MDRQGLILRSGGIWPASVIGAALVALGLQVTPVLAQDDAGADAGVSMPDSSSDESNPAEPNSNSDSGTDDSGADGGTQSASDEQEEAPEDVELRDRSEIGPGKRISGSIDVLANWTDNFFYNPDNKEGVVGWFITPNVSYGAASPRFRSTTSAGANIGFYSLAGTADDYRDLYATTNAKWTLSQAHRLGYDISLRAGHDPFGLIRTEDNGNVTRSLDRWIDERYTLEYRLGEPRSSFSLENKASVYNKSYHTNRDVACGPNDARLLCGTRYLDNDIESFETTALYHYSPKTHFQLNLVTSHINFDKDFPGTVSRDAQEYRVRGGIRWLATAKTTGDFRIGYMTRDFEQNGLSNVSNFDWVVGVDWSPIKRTSVGLQTGRQSIESYNAALFIDVTYVRVTWKQEWFPRLTTSASTGYSYADFIDLPRHDQSWYLSLRADYRVMSKLSVYAGYDMDTRYSTGDFFEYDRNSLYVGLRAFY